MNPAQPNEISDGFRTVATSPFQNVIRTVLLASEFFGEESASVAFARRSIALARELTKLGYDVHVVTPEETTIDATRYSFEVTRVTPLGLTRGPKGNLLFRVGGSFLYTLRFLLILKREHLESVIVIFHYPLLTFFTAFGARLRGVKSVVDAQDSWVYSEHSHPGHVRNAIRKALEARAMTMADHITTVTPTLRKLLSTAYQIPDSRIAVVFNGADPVPPKVPGLRDIDMIHLGSPRSYYDTLGFLEAMAGLKLTGLEPRLVFLGCSQEPYVEDVRKRIQSLGLGTQIRLLPPVPPCDVGTWLGRAKAGLFTLSNEPIYKAAIGLKVFEYLAGGLPVLHLGPADGETARLVVRTHSGLVSTTAEEFAAQYRRFVADPEMQAAASASAQAAGRTYSWAAVGYAMAEVLRRVGEPGDV